jgi:ribosome-associated protein
MVDLVVSGDVTIPEDELEWRFSTSGGPGGQHANKSATRAEVSFDVGGSRALDDVQKRRIADQLASRLRGGVVTVSADDTRSQARNREVARERLAELLVKSLEVHEPRVATKPSRSARRKRVDDKKARGRTKSLRRKPEVD